MAILLSKTALEHQRQVRPRFGNWESGANVSIHDGRVLAPSPNRKPAWAIDLESGEAKTTAYLLKTLLPSAQTVRAQNQRSQKHPVSPLAVHDTATLKQIGKGLLIEPLATGDIKARHIAFVGWPEIWSGYTKVSAWGNRIFVRTNDYLWCIGDPDKSFEAPAPIGK